MNLELIAQLEKMLEDIPALLNRLKEDEEAIELFYNDFRDALKTAIEKSVVTVNTAEGVTVNYELEEVKRLLDAALYLGVKGAGDLKNFRWYNPFKWFGADPLKGWRKDVYRIAKIFNFNNYLEYKGIEDDID